jgi:hypothetical protein
LPCGKDQATLKRRTLAYVTENFWKLRASVNQKLVRVVEDGLHQQNELIGGVNIGHRGHSEPDEDDGHLISTSMTFSSVESLTLNKHQEPILLLGKRL